MSWPRPAQDGTEEARAAGAADGASWPVVLLSAVCVLLSAAAASAPQFNTFHSEKTRLDLQPPHGAPRDGRCTWAPSTACTS